MTILSEAPAVEETGVEENTNSENFGVKDDGGISPPSTDDSTMEASTPEVSIPETYELPEGFVAMEGFDVNEVGKSLGLDQDKFNTLVQKYGELETKRIETENSQRMNAVQEIFKGEELKTFEAKAQAMLGEDYAILRDAASGSMTAPASVLKLVQKYMLKSEHAPAIQVNAVPKMTEGDLKQMMNDPRYKTDTDYRNKVSQGFKELYS